MTGFFHLPGWAMQVARRVLYFWVRTTVLPENTQELGLDPGKPVCYVLQDAYLSNLLILFNESDKSRLAPANVPFHVNGQVWPGAAFFLSRKQATEERHAPPPMLRALLQQMQQDAEWDVQLVPVIILWGRSPEKQESILKALFSETWRRTGILRRAMTVLLHGRNVLVRFSRPVSLREVADGDLDEEQTLHKLTRLFQVHFRRQRLMAIGPDLSHRHTQIDSLLETPPVRAAIAAEAEGRNILLEEAQAHARQFALEIASDYSYGTLRALKLLLSWLWERLYDGIEIHNIETVTQIAQGHSIVYVPTHRSHIDYLLLSYTLYQQGLTPPHIAAGANLNIFLVGPVLRRCGAFFLRRSFRGEPLYAAVFNEYLHVMIMRGFPIEYFIEGGRSRSGRMLPPKAGILGMTVNSFIQEHSHPLVFVPVFIGYEKLLEGRTYLRELEGRPKQSESLWGVLSSIRKIRKVFGKVYINFGEPLPLAQYLDDHRPGWAAETVAADSDWRRSMTLGVASELARRMNAAVVFNPVNLIALALLSAPRHTADEQALYRLLAHYQALVADAAYAPTVIPCPLSPREIVDYALRFGVAERISHPLGDLIHLPPTKAPLLAYFRNNVMHALALPALVACLLTNARQLDQQRVITAASGIYGLVRAELFLNLRQEDLPAATQRVLECLAGRGLLQCDADGQLATPDPTCQEFMELRQLGDCLRPTLERQFLTLALLQHEGSGMLTRQALENDCLLIAQRLSLLSAANTTEFVEKTTFSGLITHLVNDGLLLEDDTGRLHFDERIETPLTQAELLLPAETRQSIRRVACSTAPSRTS